MSLFFSSQLSQLDPYTPGEQPKDQSYVKLNANESPYPPSPGVAEVLNEQEAANLRLYGDAAARELKTALAKQYGVEPENVFVANGSDEALNFAFLAYATDGRGAAFADLTYSFYPVFCDLYHIQADVIPLKEDFSLDPRDYYGRNQTVVIANPNAPTSLALSRDEVEGIVKANPDSVVVVDEAYVDFGGESCVPLTKKYPNLLVVQTYSKSRSMAGARLGYAIGDASLIQDLETIKFSTNPFNVNSLTMKAGTAALAEQEYYDANCKAIMETRDYTAAELKKLGFEVLPSKTNFLFARKAGVNGADLYRGLKERGVLIRHFDKDRIRDYNRITIGTREQMDIFLEKLRELL